MRKLLIINTSLDKKDLTFAKNIYNNIGIGDIIHYSMITPRIINKYQKRKYSPHQDFSFL